MDELATTLRRNADELGYAITTAPRTRHGQIALNVDFLETIERRMNAAAKALLAAHDEED